MDVPLSTPARAGPDQRRAATIVGVLYLLTMGSAVLAVYLRGRLIVQEDAARTATASLASETLFRLAILSDLMTTAGVLALIVGLYIILRPISRYWALVGLVFRLVESCVFATALLSYFNFLILLDGSAYLRPIGITQLQALAYSSLSVHGSSFSIGFTFLGLGSTIFACLWLKSSYVPKVIALWGVIASILMAAISMLSIVVPSVTAALGLIYMMPLAVFEIGIGAWLLIRGLRDPERSTHL